MAEYRTLKSLGRAEFIERRSQFIATAIPANSPEEAEAFIAQVREQYKDATHNVWAYLIDSGHMRCSDDGEPSGTAGVPVLDTLKKNGIQRAAIVVTRYFGGVLLGGGGLVRAYSTSAHLGIQAAGIVTMRSCLRFCALVDYKDWGRVQNALALSPAVLETTEYDSDIKVYFHIEEPFAEKLLSSLTDLTGGNIFFSQEGSGFMEIDTK